MAMEGIRDSMKDRQGVAWREKAANFPEAPGIYQFLDGGGEVIYVGKASSLRQRVKAYLAPWDSLPPKERAIQEKAVDVLFLVTGNVVEAMLTEANLVNQLQPRLNVRLKDDKRYPYLRISLSEPWPRLSLVRSRKAGVDKYFGPFTNTGALRQTIRTLKEIFHVPSCKAKLGLKNLQPCLEYRMHRCLAPCRGNVDPAFYRLVVEEVILYLEGKGDFLLRSIQERMDRESKRLNYEGAALLRDQLFSLRSVLEKQVALTRPTVHRDLVAFRCELGETCMAILKIRAGKMTGAEHFFFSGSGQETLAEIAQAGLLQYYAATADLPKEIVPSVDPGSAQEVELLGEFLVKTRKVKLCPPPRRGERRGQMEIAMANAGEHLAIRLREKEASFSNLDLLKQVQLELGLPQIPTWAECYDISNLGPSEVVGARVVFRNGAKHRSGFRHYKIRRPGQDDYAALREVLLRRFSAGEEPHSHSADPLPDLVLIDGGQGHLRTALEALTERGLSSVPILSLAKENEWVFSPASPEAIRLPRSSPALQFLQRMRDEAHHFAVSFHRQLRSKKIRSSSLDQIAGIGPAKKRLLMQAFGSYRALQRASMAEIASIPGLGEKAARTVYNRVHHDKQ
jgi:excinuclease ABC subunit C